MTPQQAVVDHRDEVRSEVRRTGLSAGRHTSRRWLAAAAGIGFPFAIGLLLSSCHNPTRVTGGGGGGGGGGLPSGWIPVHVGEPFHGTVTGSDPVCAGPNYYYVGGPCKTFAIAVPDNGGILTVQLEWDQPDTQLALSAPSAEGWAECCQSPLTHQVPVFPGTSRVFVQTMLVGPKEPTGRPAATTSQKFTLTTSFRFQ